MKNKEELNAENFMLRLQLESLYPCHFSSNGNIPPEVQNHFLKHTLEFEKQWETAEVSSVYDIIGRPDYLPLNEVPFFDIELHIKRLQRKMEQHDIVFLYDDFDDKRSVYKYLLEVVFPEEIKKMNIPGMQTVYCYEADFER